VTCHHTNTAHCEHNQFVPGSKNIYIYIYIYISAQLAIAVLALESYAFVLACTLTLTVCLHLKHCTWVHTGLHTSQHSVHCILILPFCTTDCGSHAGLGVLVASQVGLSSTHLSQMGSCCQALWPGTVPGTTLGFTPSPCCSTGILNSWQKM